MTAVHETEEPAVDHAQPAVDHAQPAVDHAQPAVDDVALTLDSTQPVVDVIRPKVEMAKQAKATSSSEHVSKLSADVTGSAPDVDRGYAWVVLACSTCTMTVGGGLLYSVGVFNLIFLEHFSETKATVAGVGSLTMGLQYFTGPLSSVLIGWLGWRQAAILGGALAGLGVFLGSWATSIWHLYWTFGLMTGFGQGLAYVSLIVAVGHYFKRHMVLAYGANAMGAAIGSLVFPPLMHQLLAWSSWREVLAMMACLLLQTCVWGALMRPLPPEPRPVTARSDEASADVKEMESLIGEGGEGRPDERLGVKATTKNLLRTLRATFSRDFALYTCSLTLSGIGVSAVYLHLSAFAVTQGASWKEALLYLSVIAATSLLGRTVTGLAGNDSSIDVLTIHAGSLGLLGIVTVLFPPVAQFYWVRMAYAAVFGVYSGANATLYAPVTIQLVGVERLNVAFGMLMVMCGAGFMAGPFVAGALFDMTGSYHVSFYFTGVCFWISASSALLIPVAQFTAGSPGTNEVIKVKDTDSEFDNVQHLTA